MLQLPSSGSQRPPCWGWADLRQTHGYHHITKRHNLWHQQHHYIIIKGVDTFHLHMLLSYHFPPHTDLWFAVTAPDSDSHPQKPWFKVRHTIITRTHHLSHEQRNYLDDRKKIQNKTHPKNCGGKRESEKGEKQKGTGKGRRRRREERKQPCLSCQPFSAPPSASRPSHCPLCSPQNGRHCARKSPLFGRSLAAA